MKPSLTPLRTPDSSRRRAPGFPAAFTLIEMLLAISIMATILAAVSTVLFVSFHLRNSVTTTLDAAMPVEQALAGMQRDLANLIGTTVTNGSFIGPLQTQNQTNVLPGQIGPDFFTTGGQPDGLVPWGDIEKVDYLLSTPVNRMTPGKDLVRAVTRNLLPVNTIAQPDEKRTILTGVQNLTFTYYDGTSWDNQWDTTVQTNLPGGIKIQIQMASLGRNSGPPKTYELIVPIDVQLSTNPTVALP